MRLSTFNLENLFDRAAIMNLSSWEEGKSVLEDFSRLNNLIARPTYSNKIKNDLIEIMERYPGLISKGESKYIRLRDTRGKFIKKSTSGQVEIIANGRADWIGWFELVKEQVKETATENTARVIKEIDADIQCVIEVEDRIALKRFNEGTLPKVGIEPFNQVMLVDGNDDRGIDVGILTKKDFPILSMISHIYDDDEKGIIFSRDCIEYLVELASGEKLLILLNHFKSKGYGVAATSNQKRLRQSKRVREIYEKRLAEGYEYIAVVGDLNDTPDSETLAPLLNNNSTLTDVMSHSAFEDDGRPGTYANGTKSGKIDYILMSPKLVEKVQAAGIERRGVWGGKNGTLFPHFPEIQSEKDAASDHASLWVDLDI